LRCVPWLLSPDSRQRWVLIKVVGDKHNLMEYFNSFKTLLELLVLVLTLWSESPLLGIIAFCGAIYFLFIDGKYNLDK
ncbi:MAG: hypothetical protein RLP02_06370, partial [Coleofasciculus sp. C2-GNP5-27]